MKRARGEDRAEDRREADRVEEQSTPRTPVIYETVRRHGEEEMARPAVSVRTLAFGSVTALYCELWEWASACGLS